jgi:hypothetical protein
MLPTSTSKHPIYVRPVLNRNNHRCASQVGWLEAEIKRVGSQPSAKGPSEWFTGTVRVDPFFQAPDPAFVLRLGTALRRAYRGNQAGRCGLGRTRGETLARRPADNGNDAHRDPRKEGRQSARSDAFYIVMQSVWE